MSAFSSTLRGARWPRVLWPVVTAGLLLAGGLVPGGPNLKETRAAQKGDPEAQDAAHLQSAKNLHQVVIALHNFAGANKSRLPAHASYKDGKPLLSWRVAILPYIGEDK